MRKTVARVSWQASQGGPLPCVEIVDATRISTLQSNTSFDNPSRSIVKSLSNVASAAITPLIRACRYRTPTLASVEGRRKAAGCPANLDLDSELLCTAVHSVLPKRSSTPARYLYPDPIFRIPQPSPGSWAEILPLQGSLKGDSLLHLERSITMIPTNLVFSHVARRACHFAEY